MSVPLEEFARRLDESGVLGAADLTEEMERLRDLPPLADGRAWAERLVAAGRLTAFQADALLETGPAAVRLGSYVLVDLIGRGGMGDVYRAMHRSMQRPVAVKILPPHVSALPLAIERFQHEVRAAARLHHPHIVHAYDAGFERGRHFLAMEYVDGPNLSDWLREHGPLPVDTAVDYVCQAAEGLAYAHREGVVHRDVKPSNLLVSRAGEVKVLDLGIARVAGAEGLTQTGEVLGTIETMAPEQAEEGARVDGRTDVYGLGCTLYLLLTGRSIYPGSTALTILQAHRRDPIPSLRDLRPDVPPALDEAYRKMVAKRPRDRHACMEHVIEALRATPSVGDAAPVVVSAEEAPRRPRGRRRLLLAGATAAVVLALLVGGLWAGGGRRGPSAGSAPALPIRGARFHVTFTGPQDVVHDLAFSSDATRLAAASGDGGIDVYDAETGERRQRLEGHEGVVRSVVFLKDGQRLVSSSNDRTIRVWDVASGAATAVLRGHERRVRSVGVAPDGTWLASTGRDGTLRLWSLPDGTPIASAEGHTPTGHEENTGVLSLAIHPTGTYLATAGFDRCVCLWTREPLQVVERIGPLESDVGYTAFSPDGRLLAYDHDYGKIALADVPSCAPVRVLPGHNGWVLCLAFSPDSTVLATGGEDGQTKLWRVADGELLASLEGHAGAVTAVAFSPGGARLATGGDDETIRIWDVLR